MNCPVCTENLVATDRQGIEIDYCPRCRGVWLDRGELEKIIQRAAQPYTPGAQPTQGAGPGTFAPGTMGQGPGTTGQGGGFGGGGHAAGGGLPGQISQPGYGGTSYGHTPQGSHGFGSHDHGHGHGYGYGHGHHKKKKHDSFLEDVFDIFD